MVYKLSKAQIWVSWQQNPTKNHTYNYHQVVGVNVSLPYTYREEIHLLCLFTCFWYKDKFHSFIKVSKQTLQKEHTDAKLNPWISKSVNITTTKNETHNTQNTYKVKELQHSHPTREAHTRFVVYIWRDNPCSIMLPQEKFFPPHRKEHILKGNKV